MNFIARIFKFLNTLLDGSEKYIIDFLSLFVPYAVPVIPAYLTYHNTMNQMDFPKWVAITSAFVVEALGLASVATAVRFWRHNQKYSKDTNRAPFKLAVMVYVFYIVIVIVVNVILEALAGTRSGWVILAISLFSLLSFPSSVLASIRYIHNDILEERGAAKKVVKSGNEIQDTPQATGQRKRNASDYKDQIVTALNKEYQATGKVLELTDLSAKFKLDHANSKGYLSTLRSQWKKDNNIMGF